MADNDRFARTCQQFTNGTRPIPAFSLLLQATLRLGINGGSCILWKHNLGSVYNLPNYIRCSRSHQCDAWFGYCATGCTLTGALNMCFMIDTQENDFKLGLQLQVIANFWQVIRQYMEWKDEENCSHKERKPLCPNFAHLVIPQLANWPILSFARLHIIWAVFKKQRMDKQDHFWRKKLQKVKGGTIIQQPELYPIQDHGPLLLLQWPSSVTRNTHYNKTFGKWKCWVTWTSTQGTNSCEFIWRCWKQHGIVCLFG